MMNYKKVERVNSYGHDTNTYVTGPGYYELPVKNYEDDYFDGNDVKWLKREVLKVSHNFRTTLIIIQDPENKSDIQMCYYNGLEKLFKPMFDMESRRYREEVWEDEYSEFGAEAEEFYNFWCKEFDKHNK